MEPEVDFYDAKRTISEFVTEVQKITPEHVRVHPVKFNKKTKPVSIDHMVESASLNRGTILDVFDAFNEQYPEDGAWDDKQVHEFVDRYCFTHFETDSEGETIREVRIAVSYKDSAMLLSDSGNRRMDSHVTVNFTADYLTERDLEFNMDGLYKTLFQSESAEQDEQSCIEQVTKLGVLFDGDLSAHGWNSLAGYEKTKQEIINRIIRPNLQGDFFQELQKKTRKNPSQSTYNCYLFSGSYGVGKTDMARVVANKLGYNFFEVPMSSIFTKWYGESSKNLGRIFDKIRKVKNCVLLLDELDCVSSNRDNSGSHEESRRVMAVLMDNTAKIKMGEGLVVIGATNKPEHLDGALVRRFKEEIKFLLPSYEDLVAIYHHYAMHLPVEAVEELAKNSEGFSPFDVLSVCNGAESIFGEYMWGKPDLKNKVPGLGFYLKSLGEKGPTDSESKK